MITLRSNTDILIMNKIIYCLVYLLPILVSAQEFNLGSNSNRVAINDAGDYIVFQSNLQSGFQLYETYKVGNLWTAPKVINEISLPFHGLHSMGHATLNSTGDYMIFSARSNLSETFDLYYSQKIGGFWNTPVSIKTLNSNGPEIYPTFHTDDKTVYFLRSVNPTDTCMSIYSTTISNGKEFAKPTLLLEGCFKGLDFLKDGKTLWVRSNQEIDQTITDVHITTKVPFQFSKKVFQLNCSLDDSKWYVSDGKTLITHTIKPNEHIMGLWYSAAVTFEGETKSADEVIVKFNSKKGYKDSTKIKANFTYYKSAIETDTIYVSYHYPAYETIYDTLYITKRQAIENKKSVLNFKKKKKKYVFKISDSDNDNTTLSGKIKVTNQLTGEEMWVEKDPSLKGGYSVYLNEGEEYSVEVTNVKGYVYKNDNIKVGTDGSDDVAIKKIEVEKLVVGKNIELKNIYYDYNSYVLSDSSAKELNLLLELMDVNPEMKIRIEAHTDSKGTTDYNLDLSKKRAQSVVDYLVEKGVAADRLESVGLGSTKQRVVEVDEATQAQNRRVEIKIQTI